MSDGPKIEELLPSYLGHDKGHGLSCPSAGSAHVKQPKEYIQKRKNYDLGTSLLPNILS
jgi:hypothetical protein